MTRHGRSLQLLCGNAKNSKMRELVKAAIKEFAEVLGENVVVARIAGHTAGLPFGWP